MINIEFVDTNNESNLKTIALREANLWMEPTTSKADTEFWVKRFKSEKIPFVLAKYDTELRNDKNEKMYRRVYGLFIDMKSWERQHDECKTNKS